MWRALAIWIVILNTSTITLSDAMLVVEDEVVELDDIAVGESRRVEIGESRRAKVAGWKLSERIVFEWYSVLAMSG